MGKKNKNKKNKGKGKQAKQVEQNQDTGDFNLTLDYTEELKNSGSSQERNQHVPDIEPNFESTEKKAREDMDQCEELLGVRGEVELTIDAIQRQVEEERTRVKQIIKDKEYEEIKKLTRKQKKNKNEVDGIFYNKRMNQKDKLMKLYDIVYKAISENQKLKEKQIDEKSKIEDLRKENELKVLGIQKQRKQKQMLYNIFQTLKDQNIEAYKLKDEAIKQQQDAKKDMTKMFESEIEKITSSYQDQLSIKSQYESKKAELEVLAEEYKVLETQTKALIDKKDVEIHGLQEDINNKIEKELKGLMVSILTPVHAHNLQHLYMK